MIQMPVFACVFRRCFIFLQDHVSGILKVQLEEHAKKMWKECQKCKTRLIQILQVLVFSYICAFSGCFACACLFNLEVSRTTPKTNMLHLKMGTWKGRFIFELGRVNMSPRETWWHGPCFPCKKDWRRVLFLQVLVKLKTKCRFV